MGLAARTWFILAWGFLAMELVAGCGDGRPARYSVSGQVLVDGKPADRALVTFFPQDGSDPIKPRSFALTKADGSFRAFTFDKDDGVPAGEYAITVVLPQYSQDDDDDPGPDLLQGRYANPKTPRIRASIQEKDNLLPVFQLTTNAER